MEILPILRMKEKRKNIKLRTSAPTDTNYDTVRFRNCQQQFSKNLFGNNLLMPQSLYL